MSTPTRPTPGHGTRARYQRGCHCPPCEHAHRTYCRRRDYLAATGRALTIPAEPVRQHLRTLMDAGAGWLQLQAATGCSNSTLHSLLHGTRPTIRRSTAARLLALSPGDCIPGKAAVPAIGSTRRVRALYAIGYTSLAISKAARLDDKTVRVLLAGENPHTIRRVADTVAATYRHLATRPGPSKNAIRRAQAAGWHSPIAWDDIDDPCAMPDTGAGDEPLTQAEARAINGEEMRHLSSLGVAEHDIARRLGLRERHVHDTLRNLREAV
ncbi:hypothetical protein ACWD33_26325 [Streptomyces xiamenensis]